MRYIALVDGKAGAYGVVVPDLPGCTSAGSTTDEALRNAVEAVRLWVEDAINRRLGTGENRDSIGCDNVAGYFRCANMYTINHTI
jgi:predicted RNase H-like HicB family nuclease